MVVFVGGDVLKGVGVITPDSTKLVPKALPKVFTTTVAIAEVFAGDVEVGIVPEMMVPEPNMVPPEFTITVSVEYTEIEVNPGLLLPPPEPELLP